MNKGGWLFVIIAGGYIAFELSMLNKLGYRMEVDHILERMVSAQHAMTRCSQATSTEQQNFSHRLERFMGRAKRELSEANPAMDDAQIATILDGQVSDIQQSTDVAIATLGCESPEVSTLVRRYAVYARRR